MDFLNSLPFLQSLGWLTVLMLTAVWAATPSGTERRHFGWLVGFAALRLLEAAAEVVLVVPPEWRQAAAVLAGMTLWEFTRRVWNDGARRPLPVTTQLLAVEVLLLIGAVRSARTEALWFAPLDLLYAVLPALQGAGAILLLWFRAAKPANASGPRLPGLAIIGLGLFGLANGVGGSAWGLLPPGLVVLGLGWNCFAHPALRSRTSLAFALGLAGVGLLGPAAVSFHQEQLQLEEKEAVLERVESAAGLFHGEFAARLDALPWSAATRNDAQLALERIRASDPLVHRAALWRFTGNRVEVADLSQGQFLAMRRARADELAGAARVGAFAIPSDLAHGLPLAVALAPLRPGKFENPTAWLALEFPGVFWETQRQQAQRIGTALVGLLAAFGALGFVLAARQQLETARQIQVQRLEAADKAKTEFLAFLSHELRTPLQTILGRAELLRAESGPVARHAEMIDTQGRLLLRLVTDLLDLGTIEAGALRLQPAPFFLRRLLATIEDAFRPLAAAKRLFLDFSLAPEVPDTWIGDEARLRQILGNLLGNGIKYTAHGGVRLEIRSEPMVDSRTRLTFQVADTGPGLPPEKIPRLFTLFSRLDDGKNFSREGTGVGLALVHRLCALMGGTVTAANRPEGGAEFTITLTLSPATAPSAATPVPARPSTARRSILVVEDNSATKEFLVEALLSLGHEAEAVSDGRAAWNVLDEKTHDVVLLDINLPGEDGVSLARRLRRRHPHLRIIGCSAEAFPDVEAAARGAGMDAFLVKPVPLAALAQAVSADGSSTPAHLFAKLQSPRVSARTRELLAQEWPRLRSETEAAVAREDRDAPRRLSHYLRSAALLLEDAELLQLCRELAEPAQELLETLDRIDAHLTTSAASSRNFR